MAFTLVRLMVALMVLECVLATFLPSLASAPPQTYVSQKSFSAVLWTVFFTGSEEEKIEGLADKVFSVQIADLQQNIYFLSQVHATSRELILFNNHDHPPSLLALLCILMI